MTIILPTGTEVEARTPEMSQADITWGLAELAARQGNWRLYLDYYNGRHRLAFATEKFRTQFGDLFRAFSDNLCPAVVDATADRLQVSGFAAFPEAQADAGGPALTVVGGTDAGSTATATTRRVPDAVAGAAVQDIWALNRMDSRAGMFHLEALRAGEAYAVVWPHPETGRAVIYLNRADKMALRYNEEMPGLVDVAVKIWQIATGPDTGKWRATLYYPDAIEKWITEDKSDTMPEKGDKFTTYQPQGETWPLPNEYGRVPVFPFVNNAVDGEMGRSELDSVVPLQDALNKAVADMLVSMEFAALPQRWATGLEVEYETDATTGEQKAKPPFKPGADRLWYTESRDVNFGQFAAADLTQFIKVQDSLRGEIARVSRTPLHYLLLSGSFPSGEALYAAEAPLNAKVRDRQAAFGNAWEDLLGFAYRIESGAPVTLHCEWDDTQTRGEVEKAQAVQARLDIHGSKPQAMRELGYDDDQIEQFDEEREATGADVAAAALTAFGQGAPAATGFGEE